MKIIIAGAGIGGVALAALLRQRGVTAELRTYAVSPDEVRSHLQTANDLVRQKEELISVLENEKGKIAKQQNSFIDLFQSE